MQLNLRALVFLRIIWKLKKVLLWLLQMHKWIILNLDQTLLNKYLGLLTCFGTIGIYKESVYWNVDQVLKNFSAQSNFTEITLQHGCSAVNLLHIFRTPFAKNTSGGLLLFYARFKLFRGVFRTLSNIHDEAF